MDGCLQLLTGDGDLQVLTLAAAGVELLVSLIEAAVARLQSQITVKC